MELLLFSGLFDMYSIRKIAKNISFLMLSEIVTKILLFILLLVLTRFLDPASFGIYSFGLAFAGIIVILSDAGLNSLFVREAARDKKKIRWFISKALPIKVLFSVIALSLTYVISIGSGSESSRTMFLVIMVSAYSIKEIAQLFRNSFVAIEKMEVEAALKIAEHAILVSLICTALFSGEGLMFIAYAYIATAFMNLIVSMSLSFKHFNTEKFDGTKLRMYRAVSILKKSAPFAFTALFISIYFNIDSVMLSYLKGDYQTGIYNGAYRLIAILSFIPGVVVQALFPVFSRMFKESKRSIVFAYRKTMKYMFVISAPIVVGTIMLADSITIFLGREYAISAEPLKVLIFASMFIFFNFVAATVLNSIDKQLIVTKAVAAGAAINILLNIFLIPGFGYNGAAFATVATEFLIILFLAFKIKTYLKGRLFSKKNMETTFKVIASSIMMGGFILVLSYLGFNLFLNVICSIAIYSGLSLLIRVLDKEDIRLIKEAFAWH